MEYNRIYWYELKKINWIYIYIHHGIHWNIVKYGGI
jgi:hypothetical protein